jgi:site-specific DNA-methyltransferase (adenine-specific)
MKKIHINNDDNYATPPEFYEELNKRFKFDFDPCPYNEKDIDIDGLNIEWGMSNFINPPYSQKLKEAFIKKGIEEMKKGKVCVFLIPVSTSTKLFHDYIKPNATEIEFVRGRIKFGKVDNDSNFYYPVNSKGKVQSGTKDSMIVVFDGRKNISDVMNSILLSKFEIYLINTLKFDINDIVIARQQRKEFAIEWSNKYCS